MDIRKGLSKVAQEKVRLKEYVLGTSEDEDAPSSLSLWSLDTGAMVHTFRGIPCGKDGINVVNNKYIVGSHVSKPIVAMWEIGRDVPVTTSYIPEKLNCTVIDSSGTYLAGGTSSGTISIWHVPSGEYLVFYKAHFRPVSALKFIENEMILMSGGEDSLIHVWNLIDVLNASPDRDMNIKPIATFSEHTLPITSLSCGKIGGIKTGIISASLDQTCKLWSTDKDKSLCTIRCPTPLNCCTIDTLEHAVYAGGKDGIIYEKSLISVSGAPNLANPLGENVTRLFKGHSGAITSLACASYGRNLVSSSEDGVIYVWNRDSGQRIMTLKRDCKILYASLILVCHLDEKQKGPPLNTFKKYRLADKNLMIPLCQEPTEENMVSTIIDGMPDFPYPNIFQSINSDSTSTFKVSKSKSFIGLYNVTAANDMMGLHRSQMGVGDSRRQTNAIIEKLKIELLSTQSELDKRTAQFKNLEKNTLELLRNF